MNKWIKGLGILGSENEGTNQRREPPKRNMPRGKNHRIQRFHNILEI